MRSFLKKGAIICFSVTSVLALASCGESNEPLTYYITETDAVEISSILNTLKLDVENEEELTFSSSNNNVATIVGDRIFGNEVGHSVLSVNSATSTLYTVNLDVVSYTKLDPVERVSSGTVGDGLIDLSVTPYLTKNEECVISLIPKDSKDLPIQVRSSNPTVFESSINSNGKNVLIPHNVGESTLEIYGATGSLLYRQNLTVVPALETEEDYLYTLSKYDYWTGLGGYDGQAGSTRVTFLNNGSGILSSQSNCIEPFDPITFTIKKDEVSTLPFPNMVSFSVNNVESTTTWVLDTLAVFTHGREIIFYNSEGNSIDFYSPQMNKQ